MTMLLLYALLLMFFAGTEQACPLKCSCQLEAVIDCRDMGLTILSGEEGMIDGTIRTILASDNAIQQVNVSLLLLSYPSLKLLVLTNNADLECPLQPPPEITIVGCSYSTTEVTAIAPTTTTATTEQADGIFLHHNESVLDNVGSATNAPEEPLWKTLLFVTVGIVACLVFIVAFVGAVKYACSKFRKHQPLEFYSPRSLVNHNAVYVSRLDETDSIEFE